MQDLAKDALVAVIETRFHEALANGADIRELAAHAVGAVFYECVTLLELRAGAQNDPQARAVMLRCAEMLLAAQFSGPVSVSSR